MQFTLLGGETSQDIAKMIRRTQILQMAREYHEYDRVSFQNNRVWRVRSCWTHLRKSVENFNYADED